MNPTRLPVRVYRWEKSLKVQGWVGQVKHILDYASMSESDGLEVRSNLDVLEARLKVLNRDKWWVEACSKPKLVTFIEIHDRSDIRGIVRHNLSRSNRSILTKFKCGVLPILVETGRYTDIPREKRTCKLCTKNVTETEEHFLLECEGLTDVRDECFSKYAISPKDCGKVGTERIKFMLSHDNIQATCHTITCLFDARRESMYKIVEQEEQEQNTGETQQQTQQQIAKN